jgi:hypothetical protein
MLDDTTKLLLGPVLALIPILIWELAIKPSRSRRNIALLMMAEVELNLEEIAYYLAVREEDPNGAGPVPNLLLPRGSFAAVQTSLGELPPADVRELIRFYAITGKIEATHLGLAATSARLERATTSMEIEALTDSIATGNRTLRALLDDAWEVGTEVRELLDELVRTGWMDAPPPIADASVIRAEARARRATRLSKA